MAISKLWIHMTCPRINWYKKNIFQTVTTLLLNCKSWRLKRARLRKSFTILWMVFDHKQFIRGGMVFCLKNCPDILWKKQVWYHWYINKQLYLKKFYSLFPIFCDKIFLSIINKMIPVSYTIIVINKLNIFIKKKRFKKIAWIWSYHLHLQWKLKLLARNFTWGNKVKHCWVMSTNFLFSKVCGQCPAMFCHNTSSKLSRP